MKALRVSRRFLAELNRTSVGSICDTDVMLFLLMSLFVCSALELICTWLVCWLL